MSEIEEFSVADGSVPVEDRDEDVSVVDAGERAAKVRAFKEKAQAREEFTKKAESFDFAAFVEGARPGRVTVRLYGRPDLDEQLTLLDAELREAVMRRDGVRAKTLQGEIERVRDDYFAASVDVVLEEKSRDWQARKTAELKAAGVSDDKGVTLGLVAAQVAAPEGITAELLADFAKIAPKQVRTLCKAWAAVSDAPDTELPTF